MNNHATLPREMSETTRQETITAVREIYAKRLKLIDRAIKAAELAREHTLGYTSIHGAIYSLKDARRKVEQRLEQEIKYWEKLE